MRATLAWSYAPLRPAEQALFRRLGAFVGGCTLAMAEPVAAAAEPLGVGVVDGLDGLVRHSLLRQEEQDGEPRLLLPETMREFALERRAQAGEAEPTRAAQAEALLRRLDGDLGPQRWDRGPHGPLRSIRQLERERENLRLATRTTPLRFHAGPRAEGLAWLRRFLDQAPAGLPGWLRLRALWCAGLLAGTVGAAAEARAYVTEGLALAEACRDEPRVALFLSPVGALARREGDLTAARTAAERRLALARRIGLLEMQASALMDVATVAQLRGATDEAAARCRETLALIPRERWALRVLGYLALEAGRPEEAGAHLREGLAETWRRRWDADALANLHALATLARVEGRWERAARLLGAADAGLERLGGALDDALGRRERERTLAAAREQLGEPAFAAAYAAGRTLSLEQAVAEALAEPPTTA